MNVLVCETDRIGDLVLTTPVIKSIKMDNNNNAVGVLVSDYTKELLKNSPYISKTYSYSEERTKLAREIKKDSYDIALILYPTFDIARFVWSCGIKKRIGLGFKWYQFLYTKSVIQHRSKIEKHQAEYNLDFLKEIGIKTICRDLEMFPSKEDYDFADKFFENNLLNNIRVIGVHPSSGNSSLNITPGQMAKIITDLSGKFKAKILLTGSGKDKKNVNETISNLKPGFTVIPYNITLMQLAAVISKCCLFISNSTGPLHIAAALKIPTISFYSPVFVHSSKRWGPFQGNNLVLTPDIECPSYWKCRGEKCRFYNCMDFSRDFGAVMKKITDFTETIIKR